MPAALLLLLLLLLHPWCVAGGEDDQSAELILALQKATSYLELAYPEFIIDGFVGYAFLIGWINGTMKKCETEPEMKSQYQELKSIMNRLSNLIPKIKEFPNQNDQHVFDVLKRIISGDFWNPPPSFGKTEPALAYDQMTGSKCTVLQYSDGCLTDVLATSDDAKEACSVTPFCEELMTHPGCDGYHLSHQLFYFMIANQNGCTNKLFKEETKHYSDIFCANMMKINQAIEQNNYQENRDLFSENIMFCVMAGYSDFLKPKWLKEILTWQDSETGCFGKIDRPKHASVESIKKGNQSPRRVKRTEIILTDGCLCHFTSIAVGALGAFLPTLRPLCWNML